MTPGALTREQVEYICEHAIINGHYSTRVSTAYTIKAHDAALRATIAQQAQEIERLTEERDGWKDIILTERRGRLKTKAQLTAMTTERDTFKGAMLSQDERERMAGESCGVPYAESGCDWPDRMAEIVVGLKQQLAASQARCAKFEAIVCDHENGACNRTIATLQATLAEREARIEHLEGVLKFVGVSENADSIIMDMKKYHASHRCENHMADPWRGIDTEIDCFVCLKQQRDSAVQEAGRLKIAADPKWNTQPLLILEQQVVSIQWSADAQGAYVSRPLIDQWIKTVNGVRLFKEACKAIAERNTYMNPNADDGGNHGGPRSCEYGCGSVIASEIDKLEL